MGKRRKRLTMAKYAKKYATKRAAIALKTGKVENKLIEIDMTSGEEVKQEETVQVVSNSTVAEEKADTPPWNPEPELQVVQIEEPKVEAAPPVEAKKPTRKRATTSKKRTTTTRRRTTKKAEE